DRKSVYITVAVEEGQHYTIKGFELSGKLVLTRKQYIDKINLKSGEVFSRQKVIVSEIAINKLLVENGYMFGNISLRPQILDKTKQVFLIFDIKSGKRAYVRRITFSDNNRTNDDVLRREVMQWESAPASTVKLDDSKHRLSLLPFIKDVEMTV